jgi:macrolide transport system ATP-binding/permease protein
MMNINHINFNNVSFSYETMLQPLFQDISIHFTSGWTGVVGVNGCGKTTLLKLATGLLNPEYGSITKPFNPVYCEQRTDFFPDQFKEFFNSHSPEMFFLKAKLKIDGSWTDRWSTLSHGERKKVQIAIALWQQPDLLAIDEPTNHIDRATKSVVFKALKSYKGIGIIVSHDREILDTLCYQCILIDSPQVITRPGGITETLKIAHHEEKTVQRQLQIRKNIYKKIKQEEKRRKDIAQKSDKKRSKKGLSKGDHDAREKQDRARISGKDGVAGKLQKQLDGRIKRIENEMKSIHMKKQYRSGIWLPGSRSKRDYLLQLAGDNLPLGENKKLVYPDLIIYPEDRIALTGDNGSGKSTLIGYIVNHLNVSAQHVTYIPQEIDLNESRHILSVIKELPGDKKGHLMTIVSCLGSRPDRLLDSTEPSPGELRKLLLALGMTLEPHIIIMDEPTNHMDLLSIQCLEDALANCPCALLLISHDRHFLEKLTIKEWKIIEEKKDTEYLVKL